MRSPTRRRTASGWRSAAAGTAWCAACRGPGRICWPRRPAGRSLPRRRYRRRGRRTCASAGTAASCPTRWGSGRCPRSRRGCPAGMAGWTALSARRGVRPSRCSGSIRTTRVTDPDKRQPPPHWEADVVAADGGIVHLRPIRPGDAEALVRFHAGLSQRTRYLRYFSAYPRIPPRDLERFANVDYHDRVALVAELGGEIIAVGRYERNPGTDEAEVAFVVADAHQGRGIGSVLLEHLAAAARERGLKRFTAVVLAENSGMIRVFRDAGYEITRHVEYGEVTLQFDIDETAMTEAVMHEREQRAEARSIARLLQPSSVAVVGASNDAGKIGNAVFQNLLRMGLDGPLYPVNPEARHVAGVRAYPSGARRPRRDRSRGDRGARTDRPGRRRRVRAARRARPDRDHRRLRRTARR